MKIAKGEQVQVEGAPATIRKVSRIPTMIKQGTKYVPMVRVYWKQGKRRGHTDCVVDEGLEVVVG